MSHGPRSLTGQEEAFDRPGEVRAMDARPVPDLPALAVVGAVPMAPAVRMVVELVRALGDAGRKPGALLVRRRASGRSITAAGAEHPVAVAGAKPAWLVDAAPEQASEALAEAWQRFPEGGVVVTSGSDVPALYRPALTILVSGGLAPFAWATSVRAIRDRLDVELVEPRPGFAMELVRRWPD